MQHILIPVIIVLLIGLTFTVVKWRGGLHVTFSQRVATTRRSSIFYALLFLITLLFFMWFVAAWFVPQKQLPGAFLWFAYIAVVFQILCTWFPEVEGWKTTVHRLLTGISGFAMLPLVFILATSSSLSLFIRVTAWLALCTMIVLLAIALRHQKGHKWALLLQIGYYTAFFFVMVLTTYF